MAINALLCRWNDGWREVLHPGSIAAIGRREAFLSLGAIETVEEVDRVAGMQLTVVAFPRTAIATDLAPMGDADRPYFAFNVGDTIGVPDYGTGTISQRVRALTGSEDDNGEITYSPELGDLILARLNPEGYHEQSRTNIIERRERAPIWAHPAYAGSRAYARSDSELICVELLPPSASAGEKP